MARSSFKAMYYARELMKILNKSITVYEMYPPFKVFLISIVYIYSRSII